MPTGGEIAEKINKLRVELEELRAIRESAQIKGSRQAMIALDSAIRTTKYEYDYHAKARYKYDPYVPEGQG